ncbi:MAG: sugar ABC transporter permease [Brachybacterium sp.]|uniref:carbohydrate ABC transporter permease n=1 Tax=Brachybacterium sp. TaxID=1891286 RepID=UPI002649786C|nr:sugar ABC transporter permease [Brachybacterium sp.]MDN5687915.1 sugar ABC transporter permease [Brachybacterium sp.]
MTSSSTTVAPAVEDRPAIDRAASRPERRRGLRTHSPLSPWLLMAPALLAAIVFVLFPFLNTIVLSFTDAQPLVGGSFTGLQNYRDLLADPMFWVALRNCLLYVIGAVPPLVVLPLLLAMLVRKAVPGIGAIRTAVYTPVIASVVVTGLIWTWILDSRGLVNSVMSSLGVISSPIPFLTDEYLLLASSIIVTVWQGLGYYMVVYLAVLANVPTSLHEAAMMDGASPVRRFFTVTLPAMRTTMLLIGVISSLAAFRVFSEIFVLSGGTGGPGGRSSSLVMLIRESGTGLSGRLGYSSAISIVLFLLTVLLMIANLRLSSRKES